MSFQLGEVVVEEGRDRPSKAMVMVGNEGIYLQLSTTYGGHGFIVLTPQQARDLGVLLVKAGERYTALMDQVQLLDQEREALSTREKSVIEDLLK